MLQAAELTEHASLDAMARSLGERTVACLSAAIAERGEALLAVSGGSTPKPLYQYLSTQPLDWSRVTVVLVDERWVDPGETGSNETLVRNTLLRGRAEAAHFVGLKTPGSTPQDGLAAAQARLAPIVLPFDLVLLGIGQDGHTASWFPHARGLDAALKTDGPRVAAIEARRSPVTGDLTHRITLTRSALAGARQVWVLFAGADKRRTWEQAQGEGDIEDMPVRALLRDPECQPEAHWAP